MLGSTLLNDRWRYQFLVLQVQYEYILINPNGVEFSEALTVLNNRNAVLGPNDDRVGV